MSNEKKLTFKHSGDLGDVIFSLPTIRALGGGQLLLDPEGGESSPYVRFADKTRTKLNSKSIEAIKPLLELQPYIDSVKPWTGEKVDYDLDEFRANVKFNNLSDSHLKAFNLDFSERDSAWITNVDPIKLDKKIVIARSPRVQGNHSFWENNLPAFKDNCVFVGFEKEHDIFEYTFGHKVEHYKTETIMDLARVISGCDKFYGNQGFAHAIAEGMKKELINEVYRVYPAAVFKRKGADYV
jgi:hypothetical protein